jgi:hypothetical protein
MALRHLHRGGRPAVAHGRVSRPSRRGVVGRAPSNVVRVVNAANHTQRMKLGVDYRIRATSQVVAGHLRTAGLTRAPRVRGSR